MKMQKKSLYVSKKTKQNFILHKIQNWNPSDGPMTAD